MHSVHTYLISWANVGPICSDDVVNSSNSSYLRLQSC